VTSTFRDAFKNKLSNTYLLSEEFRKKKTTENYLLAVSFPSKRPHLTRSKLRDRL